MLSEEKHALAFLVSKANHTRSLEEKTILAGSGSARTLTAGMVLGRRLSGTATSAATAGNTGTGMMGAVTVSAGAKQGAYKLVIIEPGSDVGQFAVYDPDGIFVKKGTVASAFSAGGLAFTLADGGTDFVAGDSFTIQVTITSEKWLQLDPAATTGEQEAAGILGYDISAADAVDQPGAVIVTRDAEVNSGDITWPGGITAAQTAQAQADLARNGIVFRTAA